MLTQFTQTCSECFAALQRVRNMQQSASKGVRQSFITALVFWRLGYGSATLAGLPKQLLDRLHAVCAKCHCMADLSSSVGPRSASIAQCTLASSSRTDFIPAGGARVSLSPRLCTRLSDDRTAARLWPRHASKFALFWHVSAHGSMHLLYYHCRPCLPGSCCITVCWSQFEYLSVFRSRLKTDLFASLAAHADYTNVP